jgi:hypothetical protein
MAANDRVTPGAHTTNWRFGYRDSGLLLAHSGATISL